jgi:hypothetical protein
MPQFTESGFVTESLNWTNQKLVGVVCDDVDAAIATLGPSIISLNAGNSRDVRVYSADADTMNFLTIDRYDVPVNTDKIFDYSWNPQPTIENEQDLISLEFIRKDAVANDYIACFFIVINPGIHSIDKDASEIIMDYTYFDPFGESNVRHRELKRELYQYYIYNQDESFVYDFKTF